MPDDKKFTDQSQFELIYSALVDKYPGIKADGEITMFQFSEGPLEANWKSGSDIAAYDFANCVSASLDGFYEPSPSPLTAAYQDLILSIKPAKYEDNPTYMGYLNQKSDYIAKRDALYEKISVAWASFVEQNTGPDGKVAMTKEEWSKDPAEGLEYYDDLKDIIEQINTLGSKITQLTKSMDAALSSAQSDFTNEKYMSNYKQEDGQMVKNPRIIIEGNLVDDMSKWDRNPDTQNDFSVIINKESTVTSPWKTVYDNQVHHSCLHTKISSVVNTSRIIADEKYKLEIYFKGFKSYKITFGEWFHESYVNPKTAQFPEGSTVNSDTFFGQDGSLHAIPSEIWVVYKPKIVLTVSSKLYKQEFEGNSALSFDSFDLFSLQFKFDGLASLKPVSNGEGDDATTTITIDSPVSSTPQVFGVTSLLKYNND